MPYLDKRLVGQEQIREFIDIFGFTMPNFTDDEVEASEVMEVTCSNFSDPGEDWSEFKLIDKGGSTIACRRARG